MSDHPSHAQWTSKHALDAVRPQVRALLQAIPAFSGLDDEERRRMAADTVKVLSYIADPNAVSDSVQATAERAAPPPAARGLAQADSIKNFGKLTEGLPDTAGTNFQAGAVNAGTNAFTSLVNKVDFPKFVGGLIKNVFQAIVESSIEQMRAYGELISNVAKSVDQFMQDNIGQGQARDFLANRFPDDLGVVIEPGAGAFAEGATPSPNARLELKSEPERLAEISAEMNVNPPITDLSDADAELRLVTAARLQMARQRQQLLSSMVMLGINRIVITDGSINAKVVFDMRATDQAKVESRASMYDRETQRNKNTSAAGVHFGWGGAASVNENLQEHMATVGSAVDESSESKAEVKAKLSGDVRVNFKSDYLPLEKMATPEMMSVIQGNSTPYNPNRPNTAAAPAP